MKNLGLIPLLNFAVIDEKRSIYRCAQPLYKHQYEFISQVLDVNTVVNLRAEKNIDAEFCPSLGIEMVTYPVVDHQPPTKELAKDYVKWAKTKSGILIHCEHGHGRTSTFSVLTHVALGYSIDEALVIERSKYHYHFRHEAQEKFLRTLKF